MKHLKKLISNIAKWEFGKKLLAVDYFIFCVMVGCMIFFRDIDFTGVVCAYVGQLTIATGAYYWKSKCENRMKVPIKVVESLPEEIRAQLDLTSIITAIIQSE